MRHLRTPYLPSASVKNIKMHEQKPTNQLSIYKRGLGFEIVTAVKQLYLRRPR